MARISKMSLSMRMLLLVFLPLWGLSAASIGIGTYYVVEQQTRKLKDDIKLIARAIRVPIGEAIEQGDLATVQRTLDAVFTLGQVYGASVYNKEGERVAAAGIARIDTEDSPIAEKLLEVGRDSNAYQRQAGRKVYSHFVPVTDEGGQISSLVEVTRRASDFSASIDRLSYWAWGIWGLLGLLTLVIVQLGHRQAVGRDVSQLTQMMADIGRGQLGLRAPQSGTYELAAISQALNRMLDDMVTAQAEIAAHQAHETSLNQRLERNERMATLGRFVSGIAHELGAPLNVIDGRARRLSRSVEGDAPQYELTAIRGQVHRLTRIVRQLLDFSRTSSQKQSTQLKSLITHAIDSLRHEQTDNPPLIAVNVPDMKYVCIDPDLFELAIINLLRNACQAATERVGIDYLEEAGGWSLLIWDDGRGIPPEMDLQQLVEPFFTTKPKGQGTGLGLAIAHNVVNDHGGELSLSLSQQGGVLVSLHFSKDACA